MVRSEWILRFTLVSWLISPLAFADSLIQSVRVSSEGTVHVKPCEPAFVVLDVTVDACVDGSTIGNVVAELADHVVVNDKHYRNEFRRSPLNPVAWFLLNEQLVTPPNHGKRLCQIGAMLYWNMEDDEYLFLKPGLYEVRFYPHGAVDILVENPNEQERAMISEMQKLGVEFALGVMNPGDNQAKTLAPRVEQMLVQYPDTAYTGRLRIFLGTVKLAELRSGPGVNVDDFLRERVSLARKYFEPYCQGEIDSLFEAAAAYELAQKELDYVQRSPDLGSQQIADVRRKAKDLLEKVKNSPYSLDFGPRAASKLRELNRDE